MIELLTHSNDKYIAFKDIFVSLEDFKNKNPYNAHFKIEVKSGAYGGAGEIETNLKDFIKFGNSIKKMYESLQGKALLQDILHQTFVLFECDKRGHIVVSGFIEEYETHQTLKFSFVTDQSSLKSFMEQLNTFIGSIE